MYSNTACKQSATFRRTALACTLAFLAATATSVAQYGDKITVPLSDPARPGHVIVSLVMGSITVKAYEGKDVIVSMHSKGEDAEKPAKNGMHRIPMTGSHLTAMEENNVVRIETDSYRNAVDLSIDVPVMTSLKLSSVNDGNISVTGVEGDIEVNNTNGKITLINVAGSVVAHALNDKIIATFRSVNPQKPMSFSSMNGDIDVTFPPDFKGTMIMSTDNGEVYTDFEVQLMPKKPTQTLENSRDRGGRYQVKIDNRTVHGAINGGGQEVQLKNYNGNIFIRKAGASKN